MLPYRECLLATFRDLCNHVANVRIVDGPFIRDLKPRVAARNDIGAMQNQLGVSYYDEVGIVSTMSLIS
jgi:hypothetical protein